MDIEDLLPEINRIRDPDLRVKVIEVWKEALEIGGWQIEDLAKIPFTLLIPDTKVSLAEHTRAVARMSADIGFIVKEVYGDKVPLNQDYLLAGALLHDVGKAMEYTPNKKGRVTRSEMGRLVRHPLSGLALAHQHGVPFEVLHIIGAHSQEGDLVPRGAEATIVHHVDLLNFESLKAE